jgi:outer membrane lipoprotein SlyB
MIAYDINSLIHKAIAAGFAAATVGGGAMLLNLSRNDAVQENRIQVLETSLSKLDAINLTVQQVNGKVDVLNQKLDDAKDQLARHK